MRGFPGRDGRRDTPEPITYIVAKSNPWAENYVTNGHQIGKLSWRQIAWIASWENPLTGMARMLVPSGPQTAGCSAMRIIEIVTSQPTQDVRRYWLIVIIGIYHAIWCYTVALSNYSYDIWWFLKIGMTRNHASIDWIFHEINHPAIGVAPWLRKHS